MMDYIVAIAKSSTTYSETRGFIPNEQPIYFGRATTYDVITEAPKSPKVTTGGGFITSNRAKIGLVNFTLSTGTPKSKLIARTKAWKDMMALLEGIETQDAIDDDDSYESWRALRAEADERLDRLYGTEN